jgi:hypothetical protein
MGLFSSKKKIKVSSTVYNLAGDVKDRVQYLPTTISTKIIADTAPSIGEAIQDSLIRGPGMRIRSYARWCRTQGYSERIGMLPGQMAVGKDIDYNAIIDSISHAPNQTVTVQTADIGIADYGYWADRWMLENHPTRVNDEYELDFKEEANLIELTFPSGEVLSFTPVGFNPDGQYLYVSYFLTQRNQEDPVVQGPVVSVGSESALPDTGNYDVVGSTETPGTMALVDTTVVEVTYSDLRPPTSNTTTTDHTDPYTDREDAFTLMEYHGANTDGSATTATRHFQTNFKTHKKKSVTTENTVTETIEGGVTKTTKTTTTVESVDYAYAYRKDTQHIVVSAWGPMQVIIYEQGSGNPVFDAMFESPVDMGTFVPPIPLRRWARMIGPDYQPSLYEWTTKAVKRSMDKKITQINAALEDNDNLSDIDFAYLSFGVSLNTPENSGKKYIYKFFQMINEYGAGGAAEYNAWVLAWKAADEAQKVWADWKIAQSDPTNVLFGSEEPPIVAYPKMPTKQIKVFCEKINYNMTVNWTGIAETALPGLGKPNARVGEVWFEGGGTEEFNELLLSSGIIGDRNLTGDTVRMYWQDKADSYRVMVVTGLWHTNIVYKGKGVDVHGEEALRDPEESGFIIPLHEGIYRSISLKDATQMATSCCYMVLNCYQVTKQKWYQSSWFKIVLIVAVIVVTIVTWGGAAPAGAGVLGTAASVGTAIGLAGTAAIIAGAAINALAGMIIAQLIMAASTALLGPKIGAIVGAIASVAVLSVGSSLANGGTAAQGLTNMATAPNLLKMSVAAGNGISGAMDSELAEIQKDIQKVQENYKTELSSIYEAWANNLGFNNSTIDVTQLTDAIGAQYENLDTFLGRTLMLGSDIAELTNGLIGSMMDLTLTTDLPA